MHIFHKWTKWEVTRFEVTDFRSGRIADVDRQQRRCTKCGRVQIARLEYY